MNNDRSINQNNHPEGALQIDLRVRERETQFAELATEERFVVASNPQKRSLWLPIRVFMNVLIS